MTFFAVVCGVDLKYRPRARLLALAPAPHLQYLEGRSYGGMAWGCSNHG